LRRRRCPQRPRYWPTGTARSSGASLNGPKIWLPDWSEADVGVERDFNGIRAPWVAQLNMGDKTGPGMTNYKP